MHRERKTASPEVALGIESLVPHIWEPEERNGHVNLPAATRTRQVVDSAWALGVLAAIALVGLLAYAAHDWLPQTLPTILLRP